jgi:formate-dependent phosphoribosylglycinamide formyltransferase (GAR transformylase)
MNVVMLSPGFPLEMSFFTRALAAVGATVIGVGDQPREALPDAARQALSHYEHVALADHDAVLAALRGVSRHVSIDELECLWEPYLILAARLREDLGLPGMTVAQTMPFRDKGQMKLALDAAGIRTPVHARCSTLAEVWDAAERIGYPLIVKPITGAGSADTYRVDSTEDLGTVLALVRHVSEVSVEEFVEADEFTFDTVCADGRILFENVSWYRPRPLEARSHEWISPMTVVLRDLTDPGLDAGRAMGRQTLEVLGFRSGFTHMEWYRKADGEVVFGEIGARPPGGRTVDVMNFATDADLFLAWAEAAVHGRISQVLERRYNAASIFKRAEGSGHIARIEGLERLLTDHGDAVAALELLPVGAHRRDWRATLISDGMVIVRHPELSDLIRIADRFASELRMYAG